MYIRYSCVFEIFLWLFSLIFILLPLHISKDIVLSHLPLWSSGCLKTFLKRDLPPNSFITACHHLIGHLDFSAVSCLTELLCSFRICQTFLEACCGLSLLVLVMRGRIREDRICRWLWYHVWPTVKCYGGTSRGPWEDRKQPKCGSHTTLNTTFDSV